ncbi:MAG: cytochrome c551/c552 [Saprospiraceae bacterium]|jgi:cytochrome c551/c552
MKKLMILFSILIIYACGSSSNETDTGSTEKPKSMIEDEVPDDGKGIGEIIHVDLNSPLNTAMVAVGKGIFELKCAACHRLTAQKVVGPGWKGVTERRKPEWIMNMTLNVDVMLDKDPVANALFKECLTRMPNQNLTKEDARAVLEFMYDNDAK